MGSSTSKPTPETQHILEQAGQTLDGESVVSPQQVQAIEELTPQQKNVLSRELQQIKKKTDQQIEHLKQQGEHAKNQQAIVEANVEAHIKNIQELGKEQAKAAIKEFTQKKLTKTKTKSGIQSKCKVWKKEKINPVTGKSVTNKKSIVAKTLKNACRNKNTRRDTCKNPNVSLKSGKPYTEKSSTRKLLNKLCEN